MLRPHEEGVFAELETVKVFAWASEFGVETRGFSPGTPFHAGRAIEKLKELLPRVQAAVDLERQASGPPEAALPLPPIKDVRGARKPRVSLEEANRLMQEALQDGSIDRLSWTAQQWGEYCRCSPATVVKTAMWREGKTARERSRQERREARRPRDGRPRSRRVVNE
jgi:hypothetical protein